MSEVFEGLWLTPEKFDPTGGSLLSFLRMRAKGLSIDTVRSDVRRQGRENAAEAEPHCQQYGVEEGPIASDSFREMQKALGLLPQSEADPIYLAYFKRMSYKTVAIQLGLPEGTVKSRIRNRLARLRSSTILQSQLDDERFR